MITDEKKKLLALHRLQPLSSHAHQINALTFRKYHIVPERARAILGN